MNDDATDSVLVPMAVAGGARVPTLTVLTGPRELIGTMVRVERDALLGRGLDSILRLVADGVSRRHAIVQRSGPDFVVKDLDSKNGTFVNGERVSNAVLKNGDLIQVGSNVLIKFAWVNALEEHVQALLVQNATVDSLTSGR